MRANRQRRRSSRGTAGAADSIVTLLVPMRAPPPRKASKSYVAAWLAHAMNCGGIPVSAVRRRGRRASAACQAQRGQRLIRAGSCLVDDRLRHRPVACVIRLAAARRPPLKSERGQPTSIKSTVRSCAMPHGRGSTRRAFAASPALPRCAPRLLPQLSSSDLPLEVPRRCCPANIRMPRQATL